MNSKTSKFTKQKNLHKCTKNAIVSLFGLNLVSNLKSCQNLVCILIAKAKDNSVINILSFKHNQKNSYEKFSKIVTSLPQSKVNEVKLCK